LGFTSRRADTVSGAGIGMAIATVLRFWGTRTLVFRGEGRVGSWTG
ncbi:GtrA family protein, partial [Streptomyces sp. NPDC127574]